MAVIITNMNLPRGCFECPLREEHGWEGDWCAVSEGCDLIGETTRPDFCPLRSTDEMIAEIDNIPICYDCYDDEYISKAKLNKIIHKYCDKEQNNDKERSDRRT